MATISSIGKYQVLGTLGKGAHSTILHVRRAVDSREYALKIVPVEGADEQKFLEQAKHEFDVAHRPGRGKGREVTVSRDAEGFRSGASLAASRRG